MESFLVIALIGLLVIASIFRRGKGSRRPQSGGGFGGGGPAIPAIRMRHIITLTTIAAAAVDIIE